MPELQPSLVWADAGAEPLGVDPQPREGSVCPRGVGSHVPPRCLGPGPGQAAGWVLSLPLWKGSQEATEAFCNLCLKTLSLSDIAS